MSVSQAQTTNYILTRHRDLEDKPIMLLAGLTSLEQLKLVKTYGTHPDSGLPTITIDSYVEAAKLGFKGWKNFKDSESQDIPFLRNNINANLNRLRADDIVEIGVEVFNLSSLQEEQKGN